MNYPSFSLFLLLLRIYTCIHMLWDANEMLLLPTTGKGKGGRWITRRKRKRREMNVMLCSASIYRKVVRWGRQEGSNSAKKGTKKHFLKYLFPCFSKKGQVLRRIFFFEKKEEWVYLRYLETVFVPVFFADINSSPAEKFPHSPAF